jgi:hypothetical protein
MVKDPSSPAKENAVPSLIPGGIILGGYKILFTCSRPDWGDGR